MLKSLVLEFIATVGITFVIAFCRLNNTSDFFAIGITYFMIIGSLSYAFKKTSGAHFNPALTISLIVTKQIATKKAVLYVIMQLLGSIIGALLVFIAPKELIACSWLLFGVEDGGEVAGGLRIRSLPQDVLAGFLLWLVEARTSVM